jgi:16S rRNA (guanine966-N2)-methyltransferase
MRIIAGRLRGRALEAPPGRAVRPTGSRVRESLFDILSHAPWAGLDRLRGAQALDVFAGTGALGFEALSRGAKAATFLEQDGAACRLIEANAEKLGVADEIQVLRRDALKPGRPTVLATLVFLDPPYGAGLAASALAALAEAGWLGPGALIAAELALKEDLDPPDGFEVIDVRRYGRTKLVFLGAV